MSTSILSSYIHNLLAIVRPCHRGLFLRFTTTSLTILVSYIAANVLSMQMNFIRKIFVGSIYAVSRRVERSAAVWDAQDLE